MGWGAVGTYDAEVVYHPLFRSGQFRANYHNPAVDDLLDKVQKTRDPTRPELCQRITRLLSDDAAVMPLYQQVDLYGATKLMIWKARGDERIKGYDMAVREAR